MTREEQLNYWLAGISKHNSYTGECCPDFSCCHSQLQVSLQERINFMSAIQYGKYDVVYHMCETYHLRVLLHIGHVYVGLRDFDA